MYVFLCCTCINLLSFVLNIYTFNYIAPLFAFSSSETFNLSNWFCNHRSFFFIFTPLNFIVPYLTSSLTRFTISISYFHLHGHFYLYCAFIFSDVLISPFRFTSFVHCNVRKTKRMDALSAYYDKVGKNRFRLLEVW